MKTGTKGSDAELKNESKPYLYPLFDFLVYSKLRNALGLQHCMKLAFGAAPMKKQTLDFFKSLGLILHNNYGMSESTGPQVVNFKGNPIDLNTAGPTLIGTETVIINQDNDGVGEICFRGRNRFMGYYKNEQATIETIDSNGFLHSGDQGYFNKDGNLIITGRLKELIVTAGGENVAPLPIEDLLKEKCKIISNIVVLGDDKKYLAALITLKIDEKGNLLPEILDKIKEMESDSKNIVEAINDEKIKIFIKQCVDEVNKKAVSRAQLIRKWTILPNDFSVDSGEFTPTLKLKRKFISQKYAKSIEKMYQDPKF
jgi:long-chain-fatty-acid--CoA ligase ACSBG